MNFLLMDFLLIYLFKVENGLSFVAYPEQKCKS